jgi:alanine racemase
LVFLPPLPDQIEALLGADCDLTVCDSAAITAIADTAQRRDKIASVHLKVDTGMGRLGVLPGEALAAGQQIAGNPNLRFGGIYTHFARALEKSDMATRTQFALFQKALADLQQAKINPGLRHCANSAALVRFPEMRLDAVRPGTILYGQYPSAAVPRTLKLQDTWRMQARIVSIRKVPAGSAIGYGGEFRTRRASILAVLPVGYADGFSVSPQSAARGWRGLRQLLRPAPVTVTVHGKRAPIVGRVAMQTCIADVTDIPGVAAGDCVIVPARRLMASARLPRVFSEQLD